MKRLWLVGIGALIIGFGVGVGAGYTANVSGWSLFDFAKLERGRGDQRYSDILLTVATAHRLREDKVVWNLIGDYGTATMNRLSDQRLRNEVNDARQ